MSPWGRSTGHISSCFLGLPRQGYLYMRVSTSMGETLKVEAREAEPGLHQSRDMESLFLPIPKPCNGSCYRGLSVSACWESLDLSSFSTVLQTLLVNAHAHFRKKHTWYIPDLPLTTWNTEASPLTAKSPCPSLKEGLWICRAWNKSRINGLRV